MLQPWQALRSWFAGVGSDPYYANYDRSLGNIKAELDRIQASRAARLKAWAAIRARFLGWFAAAYAAVLAFAAYVNQQPQGTYRPSQQATRVSPVFLGPPLGWLAFKLLGWLQAVLDARSARRVRLLEGKLRKQVAELKDSTRYDRTLALLQKYDPDYAPPKPLRPSSARRGGQLPVNAVAGGSVSAGQGAMVSRAAGAAANAAGSALQGAGGVMFPALAQLYSRAAESLIADDPVMLGVLRDAQTQADQLRHRLAEYEARHTRQLHEICSLKQQLGLPTEEEEASLTAWAEHSGAAGAPVQAAAMPTSPATQQAGDGEQGDGGAGQPASPGLASSPELEPHTAGQPEATEGDPAGAGGSLSRVTRKKRGGSSGGAA